MSGEISKIYRGQVTEGLLREDAAQLAAAEALQALADRLADYAASRSKRSWLSFGRSQATPPQGLYLFGPVGRGKSMLMDLFFAHVPVEAKRRVHFHQFMQEVHGWLHEWRKTNQSGQDPLPLLAKQLVARHWLLCFDEFQVYDIADAMILGRLFAACFAAGMVVVATSNVAPQDLYAGGLQRERFMPFIDLLRQHLAVLELASPHDYRLGRDQQYKFLVGSGPAVDCALQSIFAELTASATPGPTILSVQGRSLLLERTAHGVCWSDFATLCEQPKGAADYLALARHFHTLLLDGVRPLQAHERNIALRLVALIDALYEQKTRLVLASNVPVTALYVAEGAEQVQFARTLSRLAEMQAASYWEAGHRSS